MASNKDSSVTGAVKLDLNQVDVERAKELLNGVVLPPEIESFDLQVDEDWTGDPALRINYVINADRVLTPDDIKRLTHFLAEVSTLTLQANVGAFPYPRLQQAA